MEATATLKNDAETMVKFVHKNILTRFEASRALIIEEGMHFCNRAFLGMHLSLPHIL